MKRIITILLIAVLAVSLTGCFGSQNTDTRVPSTEPISSYNKNFFGLQKYLVEHCLVPDVDLSKYDPASTNEPDGTSAVRTAIYYDLLGADNGVRFYLSSDVCVDLLDFTNADNDTATAFLAEIGKNDGKVTVPGNPDEMTCVVSGSGKIVMMYNAKKSADFTDILEALKSW